MVSKPIQTFQASIRSKDMLKAYSGFLKKFVTFSQIPNIESALELSNEQIVNLLENLQKVRNNNQVNSLLESQVINLN